MRTTTFKVFVTPPGRKKKKTRKISETKGKYFSNTDPQKLSRNSSALKSDVLVTSFIIYSSLADKQL